MVSVPLRQAGLGAAAAKSAAPWDVDERSQKLLLVSPPLQASSKVAQVCTPWRSRSVIGCPQMPARASPVFLSNSSSKCSLGLSCMTLICWLLMPLLNC